MIPLLLLALAPAHAFAPTDSVWTGIEPQRVRWEHGDTQALLRQGDALRRFREAGFTGWQATFDEATGTPRTMWGAGVPVATTSGDALTADLVRLLAAHGDLLGFETLRPRSARYAPSTDTWYVDLDAPRDGLPLYRGGISARVKHGNLIALQVATSPSAPLVGSYVLTADEAIAAAISVGAAPGAVHTDTSATRVLLEQDSLRGLELVRTYEVHSRTQDPPGRWVAFVDGGTGAVLSVHNEVRFIQGSVTGRHHERVADGSPLITSPLPSVLVEGDVDDDLTDVDGLYDVTASASYTTDLHGDRIDIDNAAGPDATLTSAAPDLVWTTARATQAEIDSYVFLNQVNDWGRKVAPDVPWIDAAFESIVNIGYTCNAYWDGNTNFFRAGDGCNNTGENADVNYHEWGHGFHYFSIEAGIFDGSLSEGAADVVAFLQTGDHLIAPFFLTNGGAIRDVAPDKVYPRDYVDNYYWTHENGLIFGGAMWDLRGALIDELGEADGIATTEQIFAGLLKGGTDIPGTYLEALVADDDDGDLANGTPHLCTIFDAFSRHGLGTSADGGMALVAHEPLVNVPADVPVAIEADVSSLAPDCFPVTPESATLHWRLAGKAWNAEEVDVDGDELLGEIPAQPYGSFVEYWIEGLDSEGNPFTAPFGGKFAPYTVFVGETLEIRCEDFEADDAAFKHTVLEGDEDDDDDWQWGAPGGLGGDPAAAFSGTSVWGSDLGQDGSDGLYLPSKVDRLRMPKVETGWYTGVFLQYRRWLNVEDGFYDQAVITANDIPVWDNHASDDENAGEHHQDRQWISHSVDLDGIGDQGEVQVGWELHTDEGLQLGGWNIDDVCVLAPATPDNRLGIADFVATPGKGDAAPATLTWTNPIHAPVDRVVVVRNFAHQPTSWEDGEIVVDIADPAVGETVAAADPTIHGRAAYYAVYGSDGTDWLSWTVDGWNADSVDGDAYDASADADGDGVIDPDEKSGTSGGCGCDTTPGGAGAWLGVAGMLVALGRRRTPSGR